MDKLRVRGKPGPFWPPEPLGEDGLVDRLGRVLGVCVCVCECVSVSVSVYECVCVRACVVG